jgi:glycosyltransferase involved in cell wall biosynthesis
MLHGLANEPPVRSHGSMRVLHVSSGLDPRTGGTATAAVSVALAAQRAGAEVTLAYPADPDAKAAIAPSLVRLLEAGVKLEAFPFWERGGKRAIGWGISPALNRWVRLHASEFDVIHAHSVWVLSSLSALGSAKRAGKPFVLMPHEGLTRFDMDRAGNKALIRLKALLRRRYVARADRIVLSSELERLDSLLGDNPCAVVIPHPVFDETGPDTVPPARAGRITIGFLGRFHKKKNLHLLIDALALAPNVRLRIGGDGDPEFRRSLEARVARHGLENRVDWAGFIATDRKPAFFASVDLIVMPSQFECFGLVGAEAMSLGVPVLVSPTVGIAEAVSAGKCGLVIPPRPDALGVALSRLNRPQLAEWGAAARRVALAEYSFAAHGERLMALYRALKR